MFRSTEFQRPLPYILQVSSKYRSRTIIMFESDGSRSLMNLEVLQVSYKKTRFP